MAPKFVKCCSLAAGAEVPSRTGILSDPEIQPFGHSDNKQQICVC